MTKRITKTITLDRKTNVLRINEESVYGTTIFDVTHVRHGSHGWYDIYCNKRLLGFVTGVKTVKENW